MTKKILYKSEEYEYNLANRMKKSEVTDHIKKTQTISYYEYDFHLLRSRRRGTSSIISDSCSLINRPRKRTDVFGKPLGDNISDFAYTGKPYDPTTGMYNYGYRDYSPQTARFTTVDPIRDGSNWFVYCNNEPVNFVDMCGLCASDGSVSSVENVDWCIKKDLIYGLLDWEVNIVFSNQNGMINSPIKNDNLTSANGVYNYYKSDGTYIEKYHKGIDIAALEGTPVYAAISGKVTEIKENIDGYGNSITITNDFGVSTKYSHLQNTPTQKIGDSIKQGAQIASVGNTSATVCICAPKLSNADFCELWFFSVN